MRFGNYNQSNLLQRPQSESLWIDIHRCEREAGASHSRKICDLIAVIAWHRNMFRDRKQRPLLIDILSNASKGLIEARLNVMLLLASQRNDHQRAERSDWHID